MNKFFSSMTAKIILFICLVAALSLVNIVAIYSKHMAEAQVRHEQDIATLIDYLQVPVEDFIFTGNLTNLQRLANRTIKGGAGCGNCCHSSRWQAPGIISGATRLFIAD